MKVGDSVRLVGIPPGLDDDDRMKSRTLFEKCVGMTFRVAGFHSAEGVPFELVELEVGHVLGQEPFMHSIWVEHEYLELVLNNVV